MLHILSSCQHSKDAFTHQMTLSLYLSLGQWSGNEVGVLFFVLQLYLRWRCRIFSIYSTPLPWWGLFFSMVGVGSVVKIKLWWRCRIFFIYSTPLPWWGLFFSMVRVGSNVKIKLDYKRTVPQLHFHHHDNGFIGSSSSSLVEP